MAKIPVTESTIGKRIKAQRIRMGLTQEALAEEMCIPKSTISAYENDKVDIKSSVIVELSNLLATTPNYLLGVEQTDPYAERIAFLIGGIRDEQIKAMLLVQMEAAANFLPKS